MSTIKIFKKTWGDNLSRHVSCCLMCKSKTQQSPLLCQYCCDDLPRFNYQILQGDLSYWPKLNHLIPKRKFDHLVCLSPYQQPYKQWLSQLKYHQRFDLAPLLADLLVQQWEILHDKNWIDVPDVVIPVPLHIKKWQLRGFNQSVLIASNFAKQLGVTLQDDLVIRAQQTQQQVGMSGKERRKNLKNAFVLNQDKSIQGANHVLLIDDVVTTGSTANEISRLLKAAGVKKITVCAICLSLPEQ